MKYGRHARPRGTCGRNAFAYTPRLIATGRPTLRNTHGTFRRPPVIAPRVFPSFGGHRMRKLGVVSIVLIAAFTASLAHAGNWEFGLKAGAAFPMGDLSDFVNTGFSGGVFADYMMSPQVGFGADIAGDFFSGSDFPDPILPGVSHDVSFDVLQYGVHGIYNF